MRRRSLVVVAISLAAVAVLLIFFLAALQVIPLLPKAEPRTITVPDDYASIQEAINNASAGDTVFVRAGTYTVGGYIPIIIDESISLIGENRENTIINALPYFMEAERILVQAESVTISGFSINGTGIGLWNNASNCRIIGNNIANAVDGISAGNAIASVIDQNSISACNVGIYETSSNGVISNNNIQRNERGIVIDYAENVIVKQNTIANNSEGLRLRWYGPFYVYGNSILDNSEYGALIDENCSNSMIYNNNIAGSQIGIKLANQTETHVGKGNEVYYNNVFDNEENVVVETGQTDIVFWDNGLVGNYWSDYDGQGTYVIDEDNVDYHPLTQQVDISTAAPEPQSETPLITIAVIATVPMLVIGVGLLVYFKKRKR